MDDLKIVVARRVMPLDDKNSYWTWTLYGYKNGDGPIPVARAEYCWATPASAQRNARTFRKLLASDKPIPIKTSK